MKSAVLFSYIWLAVSAVSLALLVTGHISEVGGNMGMGLGIVMSKLNIMQAIYLAPKKEA
jgi:hypothetical protein